MARNENAEMVNESVNVERKVKIIRVKNAGRGENVGYDAHVPIKATGEVVLGYIKYALSVTGGKPLENGAEIEGSKAEWWRELTPQEVKTTERYIAGGGTSTRKGTASLAAIG